MIGEYSLDFTINLNITTVTTNATTNATAAASELVTLTPSAPFRRDSSRRLSAKLLGDLESYQQAPQLDGKWLLIPTKPGARRPPLLLRLLRLLPQRRRRQAGMHAASGRSGPAMKRMGEEGPLMPMPPPPPRCRHRHLGHLSSPLPPHLATSHPPAAAGEGPQEWYTRHFNEWMVVDGNLVTTTGLECDKIGVSYRWLPAALAGRGSCSCVFVCVGGWVWACGVWCTRVWVEWVPSSARASPTFRQPP